MRLPMETTFRSLLHFTNSKTPAMSPNLPNQNLRPFMVSWIFMGKSAEWLACFSSALAPKDIAASCPDPAAELRFSSSQSWGQHPHAARRYQESSRWGREQPVLKRPAVARGSVTCSLCSLTQSIYLLWHQKAFLGCSEEGIVPHRWWSFYKRQFPPYSFVVNIVTPTWTCGCAFSKNFEFMFSKLIIEHLKNIASFSFL